MSGASRRGETNGRPFKAGVVAGSGGRGSALAKARELILIGPGPRSVLTQSVPILEAPSVLGGAAGAGPQAPCPTLLLLDFPRIFPGR
ncbi:hypothetical protein HMPREF9057_01103 [Actinomyces sp. oral taxon 171 str. F0337]|nr:hypothetical protein HMPREF9057_01103 [Actinomyces sp. oral taxon 171 str. F0337]